MKTHVAIGTLSAALSLTLAFARPALAEQPAPAASEAAAQPAPPQPKDAQPNGAVQPTEPAPLQPTQPAPAPAPVQPTQPGPPAMPPADGNAPGAPTPQPVPNAQGAAVPAVGGGAKFRYANTWDLNLEGGAGYVLGVEKWTGFVRARPGVLLVRNDNFYQFGATAEYMGVLRRPAFGVQAEYLHLQLGVWGQIGGSIDTKGRPGGMAALGLSLFGVEAQFREFDQTSSVEVAFIGKIRVPIGILVYGLTSK